MEIGILTHHAVHNHGAMLQMYALIRVLREKGHQVRALDFKRNFDYIGAELEKKYSVSLKSIPYYTKYLMKNGINKTFYNYRKSKILNGFSAEHKMVGEYFSQADGLDGVFVGSDEVFSIDIGLNPCMWGFGVPCDVVCSYAASFGPTTLEHISQRKVAGLIQAGLQRMNKVAVRDQNSKSIVDTLGARYSVLTCDPVILYGYLEELIVSQRPSEDKFVLVYSYDANMNRPDEIKAVREYATSIGAKVFSVGYYHGWCDQSINVDPIALLAWVKHADLVVTDTFHGSVLSIIANTNFVAQTRGNSNKLLNLLEEYGLRERLSEIGHMLSIARQPIDWQAVNQQITSRRTQSMAYLDSCLEVMRHGK